MKKFLPFALLALLAAMFTLAWAQQGPSREGSETVAKPKKKDASGTPAEADLPKIPSKYDKKEGPLPTGPTFRSEATTVAVDVSVLDKNGNPITTIPKDAFRVLEDNVPQKISRIEVGQDAPMTVCLLIEFNNLFQRYWTESWYQTLTAAYGFVETLKPEDYVAVVAYDMKPEILSDFSTNRQETYGALQRLRIAGFSEANMYDALAEMEQRMSDIEGRKAIVLIASGRDTFSKLTFDKARKIMQENAVPIYAISLMQALRIIYEQYMPAETRMDWLQADNQMRTFAKETGGQSYFPRFYGEFPSIFKSISDALRTQYTLTYTPSNTTRDGKYRKIKVELVNPATGEALRIVDQKNKPMKYSVIAKAGYTAPREVE